MGLLSARRASLFTGPQGPAGPTGAAGNVGADGKPADGTTYNVQDFGVYGDNSHDDTAKIAALHQKVHDAGGGTVYFPPGKYKVSAAIPIYSNTVYKGAGGSRSQIHQTGITKSGSSVLGGYYAFVGVGVSGVLITELGFVGDNNPFFQTTLGDQNNQGAIQVHTGSTDVTVSFCRFENLYGNLCRSGDILAGKTTRFLFNIGVNCGGEVNFQDDGTMIVGNDLTQCWAIEAANVNTLVSHNVMHHCNAGIAMGGNGGYRSYRRVDIGRNISGATNATPIVISCNNHGLYAGASVQISGVVGNTAANIKGFVGTIHDANSYDLLNTAGGNTIGNGNYVSGGVVDFNGDPGCIVSYNIIDETVLGNGITIGEPQIGTIVAGNHISRIGGGYNGIQVTGTSYFADDARLIQIINNTIEATTASGIYVSRGDGHVIRGNRILIGSTPASSPIYATISGIMVQNFGGVDNITIQDNESEGTNGGYVLDACTNVVFVGNKGELIIQNAIGVGNVSFSKYENPLPVGGLVNGGLTISSGNPVFPSEYKAVDFPSNANHTFTQDEFVTQVWSITSSATLTATRDAILPLRATAPKLVTNNTTGGQSIRFIGASGTGATLVTGKTAWIWCDKVNWYLGPST